VLYAEFSTNNTEGNNWVNISDTSAVNWLFVGKQGGNIRAYLRSNDGIVIDYTTPIQSNNKVALSYKSGNIKVYVNGVLKFSSSNAFSFTSPLSRLDFHQFTGGAVESQTAWKDVRTYNTALTDAELTELTTI